jgi:hypothetical protein
MPSASAAPAHGHSLACFIRDECHRSALLDRGVGLRPWGDTETDTDDTESDPRAQRRSRGKDFIPVHSAVST